MKRKSGRKSSKKEEENSNGVESRTEQNGDTSDRDEDEAPKDKKRKSSKVSRKSVSFSSKKEDALTESDKSEDQENNEDQKEERKSSKSSRKSTKRDEESHSEEDEEDFSEKKKSSKKARKSTNKEEVKEKKAQDSEDQGEDEDDESQYEVEAVLDDKMIKGVRHYLIRWKGYEEESDTWEPEGTLDCDRLIQEFKEKKKKSGGKIKKLYKKEKKELKAADWDENEDFEVDRILEVHHRKDGKREFLVSWKGYSAAENSWEPEENMDCKDLIVRFMDKVERAKLVEERELRVNRPHVQRYTLNTEDKGRRLSKRFKGKERVQYHDAE